MNDLGMLPPCVHMQEPDKMFTEKPEALESKLLGMELSHP